MAIPVFYRNGKKLKLSEEGTRFLSSAQKILNELQFLEAAIHHFKQGESDKIRISRECYTTYHWLPRTINYYKKKSPGIEIHVVSGASHQPLD